MDEKMEPEDHTLEPLVDPASKTQPAEGGRDEVDSELGTDEHTSSREGEPTQDG